MSMHERNSTRATLGMYVCPQMREMGSVHGCCCGIAGVQKGIYMESLC